MYNIIITGTKPDEVELFPQRTSNTEKMKTLMDHIQFDDPYDTRLYQAARQMFQEQIAHVKATKNIDI